MTYCRVKRLEVNFKLFRGARAPEMDNNRPFCTEIRSDRLSESGLILQRQLLDSWNGAAAADRSGIQEDFAAATKGDRQE